jgi:hypothetical protein
MLIEVNYLAVLVATVASFIIGWAWYSPLLFVKPWMKLRGMDYEAMRAQGMKMPWGIMAGEFVTTLVTAFFIAEFAAWVGAGSAVGGLILGFWIWLGFYATTMLGQVFWEKVPLKLYAINAGRWFVSILVMAAIIGAWH